MYRFIDGRSTGKTSRLMLLAKETNGTIVCNNPRAMKEKAYAYGIVGIEFISYGEFLQLRGTDIGNYYIDELEAYIEYVQGMAGVRGRLRGYSISED
jgi:hypothetical protein